MKLILASSSPRRAEILRNAGIAIEVCAIPVDESLRAGESHDDYIQRLALAKARAAADAQRDRRDEIWVVGADTIILAGGEILTKPSSADEARNMLRRLSGTWHEVHTGLAVLHRPGADSSRAGSADERVVEEITRVQLAPLSESDLDAYLATGEWADKAGAYGIQGVGGRYVTRIEGCYFNVVGMPIGRLWILLREFGWDRPASQVADA
ncbi:MAG TPA: Maf family protein [Candidatus Limnocylindrales bacterium]|nr:Maf family protein [Candidatus Limnocylindrales bacterium]